MRVAWLVLAVLTFGVAAIGAPQAKYTLYYIDDTRNVCRAAVDAGGKSVGKPVKLTTGGGYDGFSVSSDEKRLVGFTTLKRDLDPDTGNYHTTWKCFTEEPAKKNSRRMIRVMDPLDVVPNVYWSSKNTYFMLRYGYTNLKTDVYLFATGEKVITDSPMPATISPDERYLITESKYPLKPSGTKVVDLKTGKWVEINEKMCATIWVGNTRKVAWIDSGSVYVGEITTTGSDLGFEPPKKLSTASYDLRYIPSKGLYFLMVDTQAQQLGCYSQDMAIVTQGEVLPETTDHWQAAAIVKQKKNVLPEDAVYSPDSALIACSAMLPKAKKMQVLVLDGTGHWSVTASGRDAQWKGPDNAWNPWQQLW